MNKTKRLYIECPFEEKDECKALGARWDPKARKWFIPEGLDVKPFQQWYPKDISTQKKTPDYFI